MKRNWRLSMHWFLDHDAAVWWESLNYDQLQTLSDEEFE